MLPYMDYEGGMANRCKVVLGKWGPIVMELFEPISLDPIKNGGIIFQLHDCPPEMEDFFDTMGIMV